MKRSFDYKKIVDDFEQYLKDNLSVFQSLHNTAGKIDLSFFIGKDHPHRALRAMGYSLLKQYQREFQKNNKFKELHFINALGVVERDAISYIGKNAKWVFDYLNSKLETKNLMKIRDNSRYGKLVHMLVCSGASQNNAIECISIFSGNSKTTIRDSYYSVRETGQIEVDDEINDLDLFVFLQKHAAKIQHFLEDKKFERTRKAYDQVYVILEKNTARFHDYLSYSPKRQVATAK